jgi:hypothetical protein
MRKFALAGVAAAVLLACSVALAAGTLNGKYSTTIHSSALGGQLNGTWTLDFDHGTYTVGVDGQQVLTGKYSIHGHKVTLQNGHGHVACSVRTPATYTFKLSGKKLTFRKDSGSKQCVGRDDVLSHTFTKV